jgi:hypothetical protein
MKPFKLAYAEVRFSWIRGSPGLKLSWCEIGSLANDVFIKACRMVLARKGVPFAGTRPLYINVLDVVDLQFSSLMGILIASSCNGVSICVFQQDLGSNWQNS